MGQKGVRVTRKKNPKPGFIRCRGCNGIVPYDSMCVIQTPRGSKGGISSLERCADCTFKRLIAWGIEASKAEDIRSQQTTLF